MKRLTIIAVITGFFGISSLFAQPRDVTGVVTSSEDGFPIPGATVLVKGTTTGTITDLDGIYNITISAETDVLVYSFVGMKSMEIPVGTQESIDVVLEPDLIGIEEVVAIGYGSQSRQLISGSVAKIDNEAIEDQAVSGVDQAIQGRIAGVRVNTNSGNPGAGISVRIRGSSSILASNQPLYIVDGIPVNTGDYSQQSSNFGGQNINAISDLNPADIESVEVLKDASYASMYGARAANGVVLITTKKGEKGKPKVDFSYYTGTQKIAKKIDMLSSQEFVEVMAEAVDNSPYSPSQLPPEWFANPEDIVINTDWQDEVTQEAPISEYHLSFSGGDDKFNYYLSGTHFDQLGIIIGSSYKRTSGKVNLNIQASDKLNLGAFVTMSHSDNHRISGDNNIYAPFANALACPPYEPVYNADGSYYNTSYANPVAMGKEQKNSSVSFRNLANVFVEYDILPGLEFKTELKADIMNIREESFYPVDIGIASGSNGQGLSSTTSAQKIISENTLTYKTSIQNRHNFTYLLGFSYEDNKEYYNSVTGIQFPSNDFIYLASAAEIDGGSSYSTENMLASYFGRINYDLDKKYIAHASLRADGSSRFGANNKYGLFPAASIAWRISEEDFMDNISFISNLKVRGSFGVTGNQEIGNFGSLGLWATGNNYKNRSGIAPSQFENPDLRWERTQTIETGFDMGLIDNRIFLETSLYQKNTTDLLLPRPIPATNGFSAVIENIGETQNRGVEFDLKTINIKTKDGFSWNTNLNISLNRNKIVKLYNNQPINYGIATRFEEDQEFGIFYGYSFEGVDVQDGSVIYKDLDLNDSITDDDRIIIGNPNPRYEGGLTNTFSYKGFSLDIFFQFVQGYDIFNGMRLYSDTYFGDAMTKDMLNRWQNPGDVTDVPVASFRETEYQRISSRFLEDGSFIRLKTITFSYTLPSAVLEKMKLTNLRIFISGQNIWTKTDYSGLDPELNFAGTSNVVIATDFYTTPIPKTVTFGVNVGL